MQLPNMIPMSALRQLAHWMVRPYDFLDECAQNYGDIFTIKLVGFPPLIFFSNPQAIKEIFTVDAKQFDAGKSNEILIFLLGSNSVVLLDGDRHRRQRKLLMPPFHGEKVKSYGETICQITKEVGHQWQSERPFLASKAMQDVSLEVILQAVFGLREGERYQKLKPLLTSLLDLTGSPLRSSFLFFPWLQQDLGSWSPWGKVVRQRKQVYELLQAEIDWRRSQSSTTGNDVLSLMLLARDESGQPMSDIELKDELMTILVAGHETTATVLAWALYWIHKKPAVKAKLLEELSGLEDADPMAIASLSYLTAVANESLRIYPVLPIIFPRITKQEITIDGHTFPPETTLVPSIYSLHHREDLYPEPKQFKPERFLERQFAAWEFIPFGGGNRRCLGYALAMLEIKLVLATILTNFSLKLAEEQPVKYRRRGLTIATNNGVPLVLQS